MIRNCYFSVAARTIVRADPSLRCTSMLPVHPATNSNDQQLHVSNKLTSPTIPSLGHSCTISFRICEVIDPACGNLKYVRKISRLSNLPSICPHQFPHQNNPVSSESYCLPRGKQRGYSWFFCSAPVHTIGVIILTSRTDTRALNIRLGIT